MFFMEVPQINNPANVERMEEHMRMLSDTRSTDFRFTVTPQLRLFPDRAQVSWIRTAYLAAFALFGWKYVLQPGLQPIREQFINPSASRFRCSARTTQMGILTVTICGLLSSRPSVRAYLSSGSARCFSACTE